MGEPQRRQAGQLGDLSQDSYSAMALPDLTVVRSAESNLAAAAPDNASVPSSSSSSSTLRGGSLANGATEEVEETGTGTPAEPGTEVSDHEVNILSRKRKTIIVLALCMCVLMAAMDQTIVTTAIPVIAQQFNSGSGYTWIGTAYLLTAAAFLPSWGKFSDIFGRKSVLLVAAFIFLVGSILCAAAQNISMVIMGRAVQGLGAGGLVGLVNVTISDLIPVRERGIYLAFVGFTWAFASAIGPILGGAFTQYASWRLCFWINAPLSVIAISALFFLLHLHTPTISLVDGLKRVDWLGSLFIVAGTVLFLLGMEFGGVSYPWDSPIVICFLIFGILLLVVFVFVEWKLPKLPIMPLRLFTNRTNVASYVTAFFHGFVFISGCYFLPLYFQAVRGSSVLMSGVSILPYVVVLSIVSGVNGQIISKTGSYQEPIWAGCFLMVLGTGLFTNLNQTSNWGKIVMYQVISGIGCGPLFQGPLIAIHSIIEQRDVGTATTTFAFLRSLATALGISLGLVVFQNVMQGQTATLAAMTSPRLSPEALSIVSGHSASASIPAIAKLPHEQAIVIRDAYAKGMQAMWWFFFASAIVSGLSSLAIGRHHLPTTVQSNQPAKAKKTKGTSSSSSSEKEGEGEREKGDVERGNES
ncbi:major facilitator superfamily domain-containing protein [Kalaharituber pfeilii]|nr:major facilitator superfamily domain-containing protein [Kalaharituber pfeilii]